MKKINVYTHYDNSKTVIARIIPREDRTIAERTYKNLLTKRTVGGIAGIYTDADFEIKVADKDGNVIAII